MQNGDVVPLVVHGHDHVLVGLGHKESPGLNLLAILVERGLWADLEFIRLETCLGKDYLVITAVELESLYLGSVIRNENVA